MYYLTVLFTAAHILFSPILTVSVPSAKSKTDPAKTMEEKVPDILAREEPAGGAVPFTRGEQFTYTVNYKSLPLGTSVLTFNGEKELEGHPAYEVSFVTNMPTIKDSELIYADTKSFLPLRVTRHIEKVANFPTHIVETYNQKKFNVTIKKEGKFLSKTFTIRKEMPIHNAILLTYYYRTLDPIEADHSMEVSLPTARFQITYEGTEEIRTGIGTYQAHVFSSIPPKFKVWLSTDARRIPLKIENAGTMTGYSLILSSMESPTP